MVEGLYESGTADIDDLCQLFLAVVKETSLVVFFIDGIDEVSEDYRKLKIFLKPKSEATASQVKLFISSREDTAYLKQTSNAPNLKVPAAGQTLDGDIHSYVRHAVQKSVRKRYPQH
jgi:hypothetical protein